MRWHSITGFVLLVFACSSALSFPDSYDSQIKKAAETYLPGIDWRLLKAQYYQESRLNKNAISHAGAAGIAQFMPATWAEVSRQLGLGTVSPHLTEPSIQAGAYYMQKMRLVWTSKRPDADRHSLALASYNAGAGNIIKAQKFCKNALLYAEIISCLQVVTGHHSNETKTYVRRIWEYWHQMILNIN